MTSMAPVNLPSASIRGELGQADQLLAALCVTAFDLIFSDRLNLSQGFA